MGNTTATVMTQLVSGLQTVFSTPSYTLQSNTVNYFDFSTPYYWDGLSNIIVSFCKNSTTTTVVDNTYAAAISVDYRTYFRSLATDMCTSTLGGTSGTIRPLMFLKMTSACEAPKQKIDIVIHPKPIVGLGLDITKCVNEGDQVVLDAGSQPNNGQYLWNDNTTSQTRLTDGSGTYFVKVTNQYNCSTSDTINVILRNKPVVDLGNDTSICIGVVLKLDAGNPGASYFWNTSEETQTIKTTTAGTYITTVTNGQGCSSSDTIKVKMQGQLPRVQSVQIINNGLFTFAFEAINPQYVIGYEWDFGDGSAPSFDAVPVHTYPDAQNYTAVLHLKSTCGYVNDTLSVHIVGIHQIEVPKEDIIVYPNPTKERATIMINGALKMEKVEVYNVVGQMVYKSATQNQTKHEMSMAGMVPGIYTIQIYTDKGTVSRKMEVIK